MMLPGMQNSMVSDRISGFSSGIAAAGAGDQYFSRFRVGFRCGDRDGAGWENDLWDIS
jgi:hypothetical protein